MTAQAARNLSLAISAVQAMSTGDTEGYTALIANNEPLDTILGLVDLVRVTAAVTGIDIQTLLDLAFSAANPIPEAMPGDERTSPAGS